MEEGDDNENVPAELAKNVVLSKKLPDLQPVYFISERRFAYNEE